MTPAEKYQKGMEMGRKGSSGAQIAAALGFENKQAWYDMKNYYKNKALTQRAAAQSEDNPEPAAILEGLSCVKSANCTEKPANCIDKAETFTAKPPTTPAQRIKADMDRAKARKAERKQLKPATEPVKDDEPQIEPINTDPVKKEPVKEHLAEAAPKMLVVKREFIAQGKKLQYRFFDGKIAIKQLGAHGKAITLTRIDIMVMIMELHELIMETAT